MSMTANQEVALLNNKIRVHELAKQLKSSSKRILEMLDEIGIKNKSYMSVLEDEELRKFYEKVDFSHYMWENIARRPQFMEKFVEHKNKIIPKIQWRIQVGTATELEKKILYGYLLEREELF